MTLKSYLKAVVKAPLNALGFDLVRYVHEEETPKPAPAPTHTSSARTSHWLADLGIRTVIDIGAHEGGFAVGIRKLLPEANIVSFEPIPECFEALQKRFWNVSAFKAFNLAIGDHDGEISFRRSEYTPSSSLLPMTAAHTGAFPYTAGHSEQIVKIACLDTIAPALELNGNILIKIDVQGYEDKVISGGLGLISRATLLILETSFVQLYEGQPLFEDIYDRIKSLGFRYIGSFEQLQDPSNQQILQQDAIFLRA